MMLRSWSDAVTELVAEIRAQAQRFAENHLASDAPSRVTCVDHPEIRGHMTFLVEQEGEPLVLIGVDTTHVIEEFDRVSVQPGMIFEALRRSSRTVFIDGRMAGILRAALARSA